MCHSELKYASPLPFAGSIDRKLGLHEQVRKLAAHYAFCLPTGPSEAKRAGKQQESPLEILRG